MRRVLIDHARMRKRVRRGGNPVRVALSDVLVASEAAAAEVDTLALDDAIRRLEQQDPRAAEIVRLRFYAGLSVEETAETLGISERTVKREWAFARACLYDTMGRSTRSGER
jgi:RNA polymerase sigma-70 factor (ECF subfamily)